MRRAIKPITLEAFANTKGASKMSISSLFRLGAFTLILSGLLIIIKKTVVELLLPVNIITYSTGTVAAVLGLFVITALYLY